MRFAEVAVDAPVGHGRTFSYSIPSSLEVDVGQCVRVPFGSGTRQGVVFSIPNLPQVAETRAILHVVLDGFMLSENQLCLAKWISDYYMSSLFDAAALMFPPGGRATLKTYFRPNSDSCLTTSFSLTPHQERVLAYIRSNKKVSQERLLKAMGRGTTSAMHRLIKIGIVDKFEAWSGARIGSKYRDQVSLSSFTTTLYDQLGVLTRRAPRQAALIKHLLKLRTPMLLADARRQYGSSAANGLIAKGWLETKRVQVDRDPLFGYSIKSAPPVELNSAQVTASSEIKEGLVNSTNPYHAFLLEGVTGSGKTEVYIDAVRQNMELGKKTIMLVPEIALTVQTIERFAERFPGQVAVLHSRLTAGQRFDQWWKIKQGDYAVVIGSRSGIFAPQPDLGLIIIDEEHEWTYKQYDSSPRYHVRDVAFRLAEINGSVVVLGSASPDVGSYYKARHGKLRLLRLPKRVSENSKFTSVLSLGPGLASVKVVDMRRELRDGNRSIISRTLLGSMRESLKAGSQTLLFLNRRGSASFMRCRGCGYGLRCRRCEVAMTYHKDIQRLLCHHCGYSLAPPARCPDCLRHRMTYYGTGTQGVVHEISKMFPGVEIIRWDRDTAKSPAEYEMLLERFRTGGAQILVGTQMIAKGLHFPAVTVVGVISADIGLSVPDCRAGERVFQLLCQVAGRAGRGPEKGEVVVQTFQPDNYAIKAAATQNYRQFYFEEIGYRREQGNPPFGQLIRLMYAHTNSAFSEREALRMSEGLRKERDSWGYSDIEILGPTPAYPARLKGHYRWQVFLRGVSPRRLVNQSTLAQGWVIDVDPVGAG